MRPCQLRLFWCLAIVCAVPLRAQEHAPLLGPESDARANAARTLDDEHLFAPPADLASWQVRREHVRQRVLVAAGLWPQPKKRALKPDYGPAIARPGYSVQSVRLETFPGFYLTGSLYTPLPLPKTPVPAVLSPHGHWHQGRFSERSREEAAREIAVGAERHESNARYHLQARAAGLARMGCIVFHYDMVGYADSRQLGHAEGFADVDALLELQSSFGLQTWNSLRALDFLESLPQVDAKRIAVTGASGGGTQTFILCAIDDRPSVALPAVMVSSQMQGGCVCENAPYLRVGTDNVELAALMAPRPLSLTGANDWTLHIEQRGAPELRAVYGLYQQTGSLEVRCYPQFEHNYNLVAREQCYRWFARWLGLPAPPEEAELEPITPSELSIWRDQPLPQPTADVLLKLRRTWRADVEQELDQLETLPASAKERAQLATLLSPALRVLCDLQAGWPLAVVAVERSKTDLGGVVQQELLLQADAGRQSGTARIPATLLLPEKCDGRVVLAISSAGRADFLREGARLPALLLARSGAIFLSIDAYGTGTWCQPGEAPAQRVDPARYAKYAGYGLGYERTLVAERVRDILAALTYAQQLPDCKQLMLVGLEQAASWVWLARAVTAIDVARILVERGGDPWQATTTADENFLPGIGRYRGKYDLAPLIYPAEVVSFGAGAWLRHAHDYWNAHGLAARFRELTEEEACDLIPWLAVSLPAQNDAQSPR